MGTSHNPSASVIQGEQQGGAARFVAAPLCTALLLSAPGVADSGDGTLSPVVAESAAVASDYRLGDVVAAEHTGSVTRYSGEALGRGARSVGEVLARGVGTEVRSIGAPGSFSSVSLRGAAADQVAVYLDGLLLNEAIGGGVNLAELELAHAESIEVYRGITPVQYGHGAPGGAIDIRLPRPGQGAPWRLGAEYGDFGQRAVSGLGQQHWKGWDLLGAATWREGENDFPLATPDGEERRRNADFNQQSGFVKLHRPLAGEQRVDGFARYFFKEQGLPRWDNRPNTTRFDTEIVQARGRWSNEAIAGSPWGVAAEFHASQKQEVYDDRDAAVGLGGQHNQYRTEAHGVGGYLEYVGASHTAALRADWRSEHYLGEDLAGSAQDSEADRTALNVVAGNTVYRFDDRLLLSAAVRHYAVRDEGEVQSTGIGSGFEQRRRAQRWTEPTAGVRFQLTEASAVRANLGRYVRAPNLDELFGDRGFVRGNPQLEAETGTNRDIGWAWSRQWSRPYLSALTVDLAYFHNTVEEMIVRTFDARGVGRSANLAEAELRGIEFELHSAVAPNLRLELHATAQETEHRSEMVAFDGKQLPGRSRYQYGAAAIYQPGPWEWVYSIDFQEGLYYDATNLLPAEDRTRHDVAVSRRFGSLKLAASVHNLTDESYQDYRGHPRPGRSWQLALTYTPQPR